MSSIYLPLSIRTYLSKRSFSGPWLISDAVSESYSGAVVIPSLAESSNLVQTLQSLSSNPAEYLARFMILVVVNNRDDAAASEKVDNLLTIWLLPEWKQQFGLEHLYWVDAASTGNELPEKQGVGLSRKIGMDLALPCLDYSNENPLLVCLDADTLVQPDYLAAISKHFSTAIAGGASIGYRHRHACDPRGQEVIDRYELFLRTYVLGLELAGSPYAFHTVGSAMACRASSYVNAGGMNRRLAGEDFYFLQQLHKTAGVANLSGTLVHPSPRSSNRVPFGTGRAVGDMLTDGNDRLLFYQPELFEMVGNWLACVTENQGTDGNTLLDRSGLISPHLKEFLEQAGFVGAWDGMKKNNPDAKRMLTAFHSWFDAFRTMRLMHHLTDNGYPRIQPEEAVPPLLKRAGQNGPVTVAGMLERLRIMQVS